MKLSSEKRTLFIAILVAGAFYMENLDATVITTALPQMAQTFHTSALHLSSGMSAYMVALAVFIPISGWIADRIGGRTVFASAIATFTVASVLCGLSVSTGSFAAARILQGVGGAMMVPVGRLIVLRNTEKQDLMRAFACLTWPGLLAPLIGPPVGGAIVTYLNWRWIFLLNVPLGLLGLLCTFWLIPNQRSTERKKLDVGGFLLSGSCCVALMYGLDLLARDDVSWHVAALWVLAGLVLGWLTVRHSHRHAAPLIDFSALRVQTFSIMTVAGSFFRTAALAYPFLLPLMFQIGFGRTAFVSGMLLLVTSAGNVAMKTFTTPVLRRFGFRRTLQFNGMAVVLTIGLFATLRPTTPYGILFAILFVAGMARSMQFTSLDTIGFSEVPKSQMTGANTLYSTVMQLNLALGVALGAVALRVAAAIHRTVGHPQVVDFHLALLFVALLAVGAVVPCFRLPSDAGAVVSGHAKAEDAPA